MSFLESFESFFSCDICHKKYFWKSFYRILNFQDIFFFCGSYESNIDINPIPKLCKSGIKDGTREDDETDKEKGDGHHKDRCKRDRRVSPEIKKSSTDYSLNIGPKHFFLFHCI